MTSVTSSTYGLDIGLNIQSIVSPNTSHDETANRLETTYGHKHGRTHLLGDTAPAEVVESVELVRLAQQRIEGLAGALRQVSVRRHREGGHVRQLLARVLA